MPKPWIMKMFRLWWHLWNTSNEYVYKSHRPDYKLQQYVGFLSILRHLYYWISVSWISLYLFILVWLWNKQFFAYVNHARIRSWNQPVLGNESKNSCSKKQRGLWWGSNSRLAGTHRSRVRRASHCAMPPLFPELLGVMGYVVFPELLDVTNDWFK